MGYRSIYDVGRARLAYAIIPPETRNLILQELNDQFADNGVQFKSFTLTTVDDGAFVFKIMVRIPAEIAPKNLTGKGIIKLFGKYIEAALNRNGIKFDALDEYYSGKDLSGSMAKPAFDLAFDVKLTEEELEEKWDAYQASPKEDKPKRVRKSARTVFDDIKEYVNATFGEGKYEFYQENKGLDLEITAVKETPSTKKELKQIEEWIDDNTMLKSFIDTDEDDGYLYLYIY